MFEDYRKIKVPLNFQPRQSDHTALPAPPGSMSLGMTSCCWRRAADHCAQSSEHKRQSIRATSCRNERAQRNRTGTFNLDALASAANAPVAKVLAIVSQHMIRILTEARARTLHNFLRRKRRFTLMNDPDRPTHGKSQHRHLLDGPSPQAPR
jgi:hypothetical protein